MAMHDPPHPGGIVRRQCLEALDLSVTEAAEGLGVTRQALSDLINGKAGISIDMAIRLSKAFGSSPETWLGLQMAYDLWQARGRVRSIGFGISKPLSDRAVWRSSWQRLEKCRNGGSKRWPGKRPSSRLENRLTIQVERCCIVCSPSPAGYARRSGSSRRQPFLLRPRLSRRAPTPTR